MNDTVAWMNFMEVIGKTCDSKQNEIPILKMRNKMRSGVLDGLHASHLSNIGLKAKLDSDYRNDESRRTIDMCQRFNKL